MQSFKIKENKYSFSNETIIKDSSETVNLFTVKKTWNVVNSNWKFYDPQKKEIAKITHSPFHMMPTFANSFLLFFSSRIFNLECLSYVFFQNKKKVPNCFFFAFLNFFLMNVSFIIGGRNEKEI